MLLLQVMG